MKYHVTERTNSLARKKTDSYSLLMHEFCLAGPPFQVLCESIFGRERSEIVAYTSNSKRRAANSFTIGSPLWLSYEAGLQENTGSGLKGKGNWSQKD